MSSEPGTRSARGNTRRRCASSRHAKLGCRYAPRPGCRAWGSGTIPFPATTRRSKLDFAARALQPTQVRSGFFPVSGSSARAVITFLVYRVTMGRAPGEVPGTGTVPGKAVQGKESPATLVRPARPSGSGTPGAFAGADGAHTIAVPAISPAGPDIRGYGTAGNLRRPQEVPAAWSTRAGLIRSRFPRSGPQTRTSGGYGTPGSLRLRGRASYDRSSCDQARRPGHPRGTGPLGGLVGAGGADKIAVFAIRPARTDIGGYGGSPPPEDNSRRRGGSSCAGSLFLLSERCAFSGHALRQAEHSRSGTLKPDQLG